MLKRSFIFVTVIICLLTRDAAVCQTTIQGKLLSVDGSSIPATIISIDPENNQDIFSRQYDDIIPNKDGSYQFQIQKPGLYRLTFRGVFHHDLRIPVMIYDQPTMNMNILLLPKKFNDGLYFDQKEYLEWIRVVGNFNDYDYKTGEQFLLNSDGSISAFIPVNSDTIRYYVRGLTYNQGITVLPTADEYEYQKDLGFESVLYNVFPKDSIEIRYDPKNTIPFKRHFPTGVNPMEVNLSGIMSLKDQESENWIRPLSLLQPYIKEFNIVGWEMSKGFSIESQINLQKKYTGNIFEIDLSEEFERVSKDLSKDDLHPQQKAILTMSYASILGWMAHRDRYLQRRYGQHVPKFNPDNEILKLIPEIVPPTHPAWIYNNGAVDYLLKEMEDSKRFVNYFYDVVKLHPNARAVKTVSSDIIRLYGSEYSSVEKMPVYQMILDRYGENDVARDAQMAFRNRVGE